MSNQASSLIRHLFSHFLSLEKKLSRNFRFPCQGRAQLKGVLRDERFRWERWAQGVVSSLILVLHRGETSLSSHKDKNEKLLHRWVVQVEGCPFYPAKTFFLSYKAGPDRQPIFWYTRNQKALTVVPLVSIFNCKSRDDNHLWSRMFSSRIVLSASDAPKYFHCVRILILASSKDSETIWGYLFLRLEWNDESKTQRRDDKQNNKTQQPLFRVSFAVVCCMLYGTFSRGTQNSRTSLSDISVRDIWCLSFYCFFGFIA